MAVSAQQLIHVTLTASDMAIVREASAASMIGGVSRIRTRHERLNNLAEDQLVGHAGALAYCLVYYGEDLGRYQYSIARHYANMYSGVGDGGSDVPGVRVDVKTSLMRSTISHPLNYNLAVRKEERHTDTNYALALVQSYSTDEASVVVVGWIGEADLPVVVMEHGPLAGSYVVPAYKLYPLMDNRKKKAA